MAKRSQKEFSYADTFDRLMSEQGGLLVAKTERSSRNKWEVFVTEWNILSGSFGGHSSDEEYRTALLLSEIFWRHIDERRESGWPCVPGFND